MDLRQQVTRHLETQSMPFSWVPSDCHLSDAKSPEDCEVILRNDEVDRWARIAIPLPLPLCEPTDPSAIVICGGIVSAPAKKCVIQRRQTFGFPNVHWVSWLPLKGTGLMLWLRWLWEMCDGWDVHPLGKRQSACAHCVVHAIEAQFICDSVNVQPGSCSSRKPGSVTAGVALNMPFPGVIRRRMMTLYISPLADPLSFVDGLP